MARRRVRLGLALAGLLLLSVRPAAADGPLETAQQQFESCAYRDAIATLQTGLAKTPQDARILYWLTRSHFELRDYDGAIRYGENAVSQDGRNSDYWLWLGKAYGRKAEIERSLGLARKSKGAFVKAVELGPTNIPARRALIEYLTEAPPIIAGGNKSEARKHIAVVATQDPVQGHLGWGYYWAEVKEYDQAEAAYREALALKPKGVDAYFEFADFYGKRGDAARMEPIIEAAAKVDAEAPQLNYYRGVVRVLAGDRLEEAERLLTAYIEKACARSDWPSHASAHEWLGKICERLGKKAEAIEHYRKALALDPRRKEAQEGLKRLGR